MTYIHINRPAEATGCWEERVDCTQQLVVSDDVCSGTRYESGGGGGGGAKGCGVEVVSFYKFGFLWVSR